MLMVDGADTVAILYFDPLGPDTARAVDLSKDIAIQLSSAVKSVNRGLQGVTLEGNFLPRHLPENDPYNPKGWEYLIQLRPASLRFPGGASGRFMHYFPYQDKDFDEVYDSIFGYGYDIEEIIRFHDLTDEVIDADEPLYMEGIIEDLSADGVCDSCANWMNDEKYQKILEKFYEKYASQYNLPNSAPKSYVEQFVDLIDTIQERNPGHIVDVILDVNIFSVTATEVRELVEYLRSRGVNVTGVELGNECYFEWGKHLMGFDTFEDYWSWINGGATALTTAEMNYVYSGSLVPMLTDHDYITTLKRDPGFDVLIGLPAANLKNEPDSGLIYMFRGAADDGEGDVTPDWNESMTNTAFMADTVMADTIVRYTFDAIVLHTYYDAQSNWKDIVYDHLCFEYPNDGFPGCTITPTEDYCTDTSGEWTFEDYDARLVDAFDGFLGKAIFPEFGNMKQALRTRYKEYYDRQNQDFRFFMPFPAGKELWNSEWNMKANDEDTLKSQDEKLLLEIYFNTLPHVQYTQEIFLKNIKLNHSHGYRENFFTYAHYHNFAGGGISDLLSPADCGDCKGFEFAPDIDSCQGNDPETGDKINYYVPRITYQVSTLDARIMQRGLRYLKCNYSIYATNNNQQPTVFINQTYDTLYVFYSNIGDATQTYIIKYNTFLGLFPGTYDLLLLPDSVHAIYFEQPYSTSGNNEIFKRNSCYFCVKNAGSGEDNPHPVHIQHINYHESLTSECTGDLPSSSVCATVPARSVGYFAMAIQLLEDPGKEEGSGNVQGKLSVYPNPTTGLFTVKHIHQGLQTEPYAVGLYSIDGTKLETWIVKDGDLLNIESLPSGCYYLDVQTETGGRFLERLIKIE